MITYNGRKYRKASEAEQAQLEKIGHPGFRSAITGLWTTFDDLLDCLDSLDVDDPVLVGGLAVQHHGYMRMTEDIDVLLDREDYDRLLEDGKIKFGQLKYFKPGVQVDILTEGKDNNPSPDRVRDPAAPHLPTLAGLIYLKLLSDRIKDQADIVELLKVNGYNDQLEKQIAKLADQAQLDTLRKLWLKAQSELSR